MYIIIQNGQLNNRAASDEPIQTIATPPSVDNVDASRVLDAMLRNIHGTGGERSER